MKKLIKKNANNTSVVKAYKSCSCTCCSCAGISKSSNLTTLKNY